MKKILLSGVPATGKTTVSGFMAEKFGYRRVDMEADGWAAKAEFYKDEKKFLGHLAAQEADVIIDWGFGPGIDMEGVNGILDEGFAPVWLDGLRLSSLYHFARREKFNTHRLKSYFGQVRSINTSDALGMVKFAVVNPFNSIGIFRPVEEIADDIIESAA